MAGQIKRLEVFAAGTWSPGNGGKITVTESDLDEIVQTFGELQGSNIVKPHLKLGHQDAQKWFGQRTGIPTLGWIEKIWREGQKLFADVVNVPEKLIELIKQGRYHNVSAEIFRPGAIEHNGKKLGHVLSAVAILGTEMPAVKDLAGLASALFADQFTAKVEAEPIHLSMESSRHMFTQEQVDSLISAAVTKAVQGEQTKFATEAANNKTQLEVVTKRAETAEKAISDLQAKYAEQEIDGLIAGAIKDGKLLPAQKDAMKAMLSAASKTVNFGGTEKSIAEVFSSFLGASKKQVDINEQGSGRNNDNSQFASAAAEVDSKTKDAMKQNAKLDYSAAMKHVLSLDTDLAARYAAAA